MLANTRFGKHIYIIGGNKTAAYNFGINVKKTLLQVFVLSGVLAGVTGWLIAARSNGATPTVANGFFVRDACCCYYRRGQHDRRPGFAARGNEQHFTLPVRYTAL